MFKSWKDINIFQDTHPVAFICIGLVVAGFVSIGLSYLVGYTGQLATAIADAIAGAH